MGAPRGSAGHRRRVLRARWGAIAILALILAGGERDARAASTDPPRIGRIRFQGNDHLPEGDLRSRMRLKEPAWWKPFSRPRYPGSDFLAGDLRAVLVRYREEGFPFARISEAVVTFNQAGDRVDLLIRVEEGPRIYASEVALDGLDRTWRVRIEKDLPIASGEPLSWPRVESARERVLAFAADQGRMKARTDLILQYASDSARVVLDVYPGPPVQVD